MKEAEQNQISFMRIFTGPLLSFLFIFFLKKKKRENDEASFTIKGMMGHARTSGER